MRSPTPTPSAWPVSLARAAPLRGSYDKRALIEGPAAIDAEFERIMPLIKRGGIIPHTDHLVPPDVSFANYGYYRRRKREILGKPGREFGFLPEPGHITTWRLLGPFDNEKNAGFHKAQAPEPGAAPVRTFHGKHGQPLSWKVYDYASPRADYIDLKTAISAEPWSVGYAACSVYSPTRARRLAGGRQRRRR